MESSSHFGRMRCPLPRTRGDKIRHGRVRVELRGMQDPAQVRGEEVLIDTSPKGLLSSVIGADTLRLMGIRIGREEPPITEES